MIIFCVLYVFFSFFQGDYGIAVGTIAFVGICIALWKYNKKISSYIGYILFISSLIFFIGVLIFLWKSPILITSYPVFLVGYALGSYERIASLRLPRLSFKIIFGLILFIFRMAFFSRGEIYSLILQFMVMFLAITCDYWEEVRRRRLFQSYYDYREGMTKFRTLIDSGLPTNVLILTKDLSKELFRNECLTNFLEFQASLSKSNENLVHNLLGRLIIDKDTLCEGIGSFLLDKKEYNNLSLFKLLEYLNRQKGFFESQPRLTFNVEYKPDKESHKRVFETKVFSLSWDEHDSIALIINDVTEQSMNLTLKVADMNKDKMLAMITHELKTPLNGILENWRYPRKSFYKKSSKKKKFLKPLKLGQISTLKIFVKILISRV